MPDLSGFSLEDLQALQSGDLGKVSTAGLQALQGMHAAAPKARAAPRLPRLANGQVDTASPQFKAAEAGQVADMLKEGGQADPLSGGETLQVGPLNTHIPIPNFLHKSLANIGAGMSSVGDAAKQRLGMASAPTDEEIRETRRLDEKLADRTTGGKVLQVVGQAAPLLPLGLIPGMQGIAGGAALGALGGALQTTTDDESAIQNAIVGGALGGALPIVGKGLKAGWRFLRGSAGKEAAAEAMARGLGAEVGGQQAEGAGRQWATRASSADVKTEAQRVAEELAGQLRAAPSHVDVAGVKVPLSTAASLGNDTATALERNARAARAGNWGDFLKGRAESYTGGLQAATREAEDLARLTEARGDAWERGMQDALGNADTFEFGAQAAKFKDKLAGMRASPLAQRQGVRPLLSDAESAIEAAGDAYSPAHMLEYRTGLNKGFSSTSGRLTAKDAGLTELKGHIDEALDAATGGRVTPVIRGFREASPAVNAAEAAANVRGAFLDDAGRPLTRVTHDMNPEVTEAALRKAIGQQADKRFGQQLSPDAERQLNTLLDAIRKNKNVEQLNKFAAPETSATATTMLGAQAEKAARSGLRGVIEMKMPYGVGKLATGAWDVLAHGTAAQRDKVFDRMMQDPQFAAEVMAQYAKSMGPTRSADAVLTALRQGAAGGGAEAMR